MKGVGKSWDILKSFESADQKRKLYMLPKLSNIYVFAYTMDDT